MSATAPTAKSIFWEARELETPAEREALVREACGGDADLRRRVERLLAAEQRSDSFLDPPSDVAAAVEDAPPIEGPGTEIGPYKLLERIGEGGMGIVYMAAQKSPVQRTVALKIVRPGMDTREVIARFEAERQALALMEHPNIAKVFDAGTVGGVRREGEMRNAEFGMRNEEEAVSANSKFRIPNSELRTRKHSAFRIPHSAGRPYFVMELVRGVPITEFCDQHRLNLNQRLELFISVCRAVQHAHQKGVIHRDLKPTNVLVELHDVTPVPKVIDFGVAKATSQRLTERTLHTGFNQLVGTPLYMSPEQAELSGLDVDTRSDIYSLGVLLYELLTGSTPFDRETLEHAGYDEMRRMIREDDPPPPSKRLTQRTKCNDTHTTRSANQPPRSKVSPFFRTPHSAFRIRTIPHSALDLDWIVMKCLEKDRTRRYETAADLSRDIERHLADEPVHARHPSRVYRLKKFTRKHRTGMAAASAIVLALTVGVVIAAASLAEAVKERNIASDQRDRATRNLYLACGLVDDVITPAAESVQLSPGVQAVNANLVNEALLFYRGVLKEAPRDQVVRRGLANALLVRGGQQFHAGGDVLTPTNEAITVLRELIHEFPDDLELKRLLARAHAQVATYFWPNNCFREAAKAISDAARILEDVAQHDPSQAEVLELLATYRLQRAYYTARAGDHASALAQFQEGLSMGANPLQTLIARQRLGELLMRMGQFDRAAVELEQAQHLASGLPVEGQDALPKELVEFWVCEVNNWIAIHALWTGNVSLAYERNATALRDMQITATELPHLFWPKLLIGSYNVDRWEICTAADRMDEAREAAEKILANWDRDVHLDRYNSAIGHWYLGELLHLQENAAEAESHFLQAANGFDEMIGALPGEPETSAKIICFLSNCGKERFRDPGRAVRVAEHVLTPTNGPMWHYLGLARYRAGDWAGAEAALQKTNELRNGGDALSWLLLAASQHKAGRQEEARKSYAHAQQLIAARAPIYYGWINPLGYQSIRAEVETLLQPPWPDEERKDTAS